MARYGNEHKDATRRRIVQTAGRRLKRDGIAGSGVAALMADAGLTNGAFYGHFASKEELVATAVAAQLAEQRARYANLPAGVAGVEALVRDYLSVEHRDHPDEGCPSAALLEEIARGGELTKRAYTEGAVAILDDICARLAPGDPDAVRGRTTAVFALMIGALQLSRAMSDTQRADAVLADALDLALASLSAT